MDCEGLRSVAEEGLGFSGRMSALVSHELKNVLAIVNENAGLLGDLTMLGQKGQIVDPERLAAVSRALSQQVQRADLLIRDLNRFGHLASESSPADPGEILNLVVSLSARMISSREINLRIKPAPVGVAVLAPPFYLANLLWQGLDFASQAAGDERQVEVAVMREADKVKVEYSHLAGLASAADFPGEGGQKLLEWLNVDCRLEEDAGRLSLLIPAGEPSF